MTAKPEPTAKPKIAASTRNPTRCRRISDDDDQALEQLLDYRPDIARIAGELDAEQAEQPGIEEEADAGDDGAARDDRDDGPQLDQLVAVEVQQRCEEAEHRQQGHQRWHDELGRHGVRSPRLHDLQRDHPLGRRRACAP